MFNKISFKIIVLCTLFLTLNFVDGKLSYNPKITVAHPCSEEIQQNNCSLPACRCSTDDIPGNYPKNKIPQMVFLTFDDAINYANFDLYHDILHIRKNPNGHPITATFFVSHEYTNYSMVHELWRHGHEISLHSITHYPYVEYWRNLNQSMWHKEIIEQRMQMSAFAKIPLAEIRGMRAPFLQGGGDQMFEALYTSKAITWDCSRPSSKLLWPYTNDFASTQYCRIKPCAEGAYPGFWTVPMIDFIGSNGEVCSMADACIPLPITEESTFKLLQTNFWNHYAGNRAPFGIFIHSAWINSVDDLSIKRRRDGYINFLNYLATLEDVYIVSISRALEWVQQPTTLDQIVEFPAFKVQSKPSKCLKNTACSYKPSGDGGERWFHSCVSQCPKYYPWLGNPLGD